uniref:Uncharacterized protein n=1 Tax=Timema douglasi TaxID=61478 RepID=A0A7R8VNL1_TIMDO|nr:unnamed protein product [Timema douglasi]
MLWFEERAAMPQEMASQLKLLLHLPTIGLVVSITLVLVGLFTASTTVLCCVCRSVNPPLDDRLDTTHLAQVVTVRRDLLSHMTRVCFIKSRVIRRPPTESRRGKSRCYLSWIATRTPQKLYITQHNIYSSARYCPAHSGLLQAADQWSTLESWPGIIALSRLSSSPQHCHEGCFRHVTAIGANLFGTYSSLCFTNLTTHTFV